MFEVIKKASKMCVFVLPVYLHVYCADIKYVQNELSLYASAIAPHCNYTVLSASVPDSDNCS